VKGVRLHPAANSELGREAAYYEQKSVGLGLRFAAEIETALKLVSSLPSIGSPYHFETRRVFPRSFPFSVVYFETSSEIIILAIAPFSRKDGYWKTRKSNFAS
jgi:toxin ParE1/3/4